MKRISARTGKMQNFKELLNFAKSKGKKACVVVKAEDEPVLEGINLALNQGLLSKVFLVGVREAITGLSKKVNLNLKNTEIIDIADEQECLKTALSIVKEEGDFLMKGMLPTSTFLKGILDKEYGLRTGKILSHIAVLEVSGYHKLLFMSDGGMNPKLELKTRVDIINNGIWLMNRLGIKNPKIALVAASEAVHPDMPETVDAIKIVEMNKKGEIPDAIIEGPFGFDVAISKEAAMHKKIKSEIAGDVDFILMPNISAGNIWAKGLIYFAGAKAAGIVVGATKPVVLLSRADDAETKLNSIALGVAVSGNY
ncbi:MAG: phosphate acyltransferase [candidate division WOR-3 bacterium]|nr:phosphate acyltransferase [candidate division WOR-3 bacterium]